MAPVLDIQDLSTHIKLTSSVVQAVGNRVELSFARPDVKQAEHLVVIGLKGFDGDAVRRALAG